MIPDKYRGGTIYPSQRWLKVAEFEHFDIWRDELSNNAEIRFNENLISVIPLVVARQLAEDIMAAIAKATGEGEG